MLVFNRLSHDSTLHVVDLCLKDVVVHLAHWRIKLDIDNAAKDMVDREGPFGWGLQKMRQC